MMMKMFTALVLVAAALTSAFAQAPKHKMTIATGVDPSLAAFYVAKQGGYFDRNGLDVQLNTGSSGSAMVPFLVQNQVQAVLAAETAGMLNHVLDNNVVVAAEALQALRYFGLVARNIDTIDGLKGKKIGVAIGSASEVFWHALVEKLGLTPSDYTVVPVEPPEMLAALERGNIDAASAFEPWVSRTINALPYVKILRDNEGILRSRTYVYVNRGWATANPVGAEAFMKSLVQATDFVRAQPDQAAQMVATFLKLDAPLTKQLMGKIKYDIHMDSESIEYLKSIERQLRQAGRLTKPIDWDKFVFADLIKKVAAK